MDAEPGARSVAPPRAPRSPWAVAAVLAAAAAVVAVDLETKAWAKENLSLERPGPPPAACVEQPDGSWRYQRIRGIPYVVVEDLFDLDYAENCGAAFGLLRGAPSIVRGAFLEGIGVLVCVGLLVAFRLGRGGLAFAWGVPFVVAGALGNLVDRVWNGYVVDFLHIHYGDSLDWPTFNVADVAIAIGVLLLVLDAYREPEGDGAAPPADPGASAGSPRRMAEGGAGAPGSRMSRSGTDDSDAKSP